MVDKVHHVQLLCKNVEETLKIFLDKFGFRLYCKLKANTDRQSYVLKQESMLIVLNEGDYDTVVNIAFETTDVCGLLNRFEKKDILEKARTIHDKDGKVVSALVKTPVGNVVHSLLNVSEYQGEFLPDYMKCAENQGLNRPPTNTWLTHYDHITYACYAGTSHAIIAWYEKYFSFSRFFINDSEDINDGYVVQSADDHLSSFGMRLTAMEFWRCAEIGLQCGKGTDVKIKLVLAEPLSGEGPNQVRNFLSEHDGPGVQHIGLHSKDILHSVGTLKKRKVEFITPPNTYYSKEFGKPKEAELLGICFEELVKLGILLDSELDDENNQVATNVKNINELNSTNKKYLMQVFTRPLFDKETFFLEIIQRCGATGFGSGNIRALWRAIDACIYK